MSLTHSLSLSVQTQLHIRDPVVLTDLRQDLLQRLQQQAELLGEEKFGVIIRTTVDPLLLEQLQNRPDDPTTTTATATTQDSGTNT